MELRNVKSFCIVISALVCNSLKQWINEPLCSRELIGSLQTLAWDKQCVKTILQTDVIASLYQFAQVNIFPLPLANNVVIEDCFYISNLIKKFPF